MTALLRIAGAVALVAAGGVVSAALLMLFVFSIVYSNLPPIDALTDYRPKIPLRVWTSDGVLIGEFGEERRDFLPFAEIPEPLKKAILAAEDDGFYEHSGVDYSGLARAAVSNFMSGRRGQGGSTITMQVARNFFLSSERSYVRKVYEIALGVQDRVVAIEGPDLRGVCQPDLPGPARIWIFRCGADVFW
jgi:penicillin-binding protein 1A